MEENFKKISMNIGRNVILGNDITIEFNDNTQYDEEKLIFITLKKGIRLQIKKYSRIYGENDGIRYITFTNQGEEFSFEFQDQFITFNPEDMTQDILDEGLTLLLIEE